MRIWTQSRWAVVVLEVCCSDLPPTDLLWRTQWADSLRPDSVFGICSILKLGPCFLWTAVSQWLSIGSVLALVHFQSIENPSMIYLWSLQWSVWDLLWINIIVWDSSYPVHFSYLLSFHSIRRVSHFLSLSEGSPSLLLFPFLNLSQASPPNKPLHVCSTLTSAS